MSGISGGSSSSNYDNWEVLDSDVASGAGSVTLQTTEVRKGYKIVCFDALTSTTTALNMQLNDDTGANYNYTWMDSSTNYTSASGQTSFYTGTYASSVNFVLDIILAGKSAAHASGQINIMNKQGSQGGDFVLGGGWIAGNAVQFTKAVLTPASGTVSGKFYLLGWKE